MPELISLQTLATSILVVAALVAFREVWSAPQAFAPDGFCRVPPLPVPPWGWLVAATVFAGNYWIFDAFGAAMLAATALFLCARTDPVAAFGLGSPTWRNLVFAPVTAYLACLPVVLVASKLAEGAMHALGMPVEPQDVVSNFLNRGLAERWQLALLIIVIGPAIEEFLFRGVFYGSFKQSCPRWIAIAVTSLLFGAAHFHWGTVLPLAVFGVALTLAYEATGSLWTPLTMHMCFNGINLAMIAAFGVETA